MKKQDKSQKQDKLINGILRDAYGFSDEYVQEKLDEAIANPDTSPELKAPEDEFQRILNKAKERGIQPVPLNSEIASRKKSYRRIFSGKYKKVLCAAALLGVLGAGFCMSSVGKGVMKYSVIDGRKDGKNIVWNSVKSVRGVSDIDEAYEEINKKLGIPVLKLSYIPKDMFYDGLIVEDSCAILRYTLQDQIFRVREWSPYNKMSGMHNSDRKEKCTDVYNPWMKKNLEIMQGKLDSGKIEYSVEIDEEEVRAYISGIMEKEEFEKIVEGLYIKE